MYFTYFTVFNGYNFIALILNCAIVWIVFNFFIMKKLFNSMEILCFLLLSIVLLSACEAEKANVENKENIDSPKSAYDENVDDAIDVDVIADEEDVTIETDLGKIKIDEETGNGYVEMEGSSDIIIDSDSLNEKMPEDLVILEKGKNFNWAGVDGNGMLSYRLTGMDYKEVCSDQSALLQQKGWEPDEGVAVQFSGTSTNTLSKEGYILSLTCTEDSDDSDEVTVTIVKGVN